MGSGLIFLLIVGAWLAVLVPMALRSHDAAAALSTVDRFSDAMRVLSRRGAGPGLADDDDLPLVPAPAPRDPRRLTAAARRRRVLVGLVGVAVLTLVGGLLGSAVLLGAHVVADLLLVGFLAWLRATASTLAERGAPSATAGRTPVRRADPAQASAHEPTRAAPVVVPEQPAAPYEDVVFDQEAFPAAVAAAQPTGTPSPSAVPAEPLAPARGAKGEPWQPVPVPVPIYVTAARAPRRVLDLTVPRPAPAAAPDSALASAERSLGIDDRGPELEHILGRRAVGG